MESYFRQYLRFYFPLSLQAASISLSYPLVSMVASRGAGGVVNFAGFSQSNSVMFLLMTLGGGLGITGLIFGRNREGFGQYLKLNYRIAFTIVLLQSLLCVPPVSHLLFGTLLGLSPSLERPAHIALLSTIPAQFIFLIRNPYQIVLLINKSAGLSSATTLARIGFTACLSPLFIKLGWVGVFWAVVCLTLPIILETLLAYRFAAPFLAKMPAAGGEPPPIRRLLAFTFPLSLGGIFLALSGMMLGAFIARAADPDRILPVFYVASSLANPMASANIPLQQVVLAFPPHGPKDRSTLQFALAAGAVTGLLPLLFLFPPLSELYYVGLQKLAPADLPLLRTCALLFFFYPIAISIRAQGEGIAAHLKKPVTVLAGHAVYLGTLVTCAFVLVSLNTPGHLMGPIAIIAANIAATLILRLSIHWETETDIPVPLTRSSQTQA